MCRMLRWVVLAAEAKRKCSGCHHMAEGEDKSTFDVEGDLPLLLLAAAAAAATAAAAEEVAAACWSAFSFSRFC